MRSLSIAVFVMIATQPASAEDNIKVFDQSGKYSGAYICSAEGGTGFIYNKQKKRWQPNIYSVNSVSFQLRITPTQIEDFELGELSEKAVRYKIEVIDGQSKNGLCVSLISAIYGDLETMTIGVDGDFKCVSNYFNYDIDLTQNKYVRSFTGRFSSDIDESAIGPYVEVGRCRKLN